MKIIHAYTREDALKDGALVDVTEMAKEAGFLIPVAVTNAVWSYIADGDINGRLWDTIFTLSCAVRKPLPTDVLLYKVQYGNRLVELKAIRGLGDNCEPVITIMLPEED